MVINTPLLFYNPNKKNAWLRAYKKVLSTYKVNLNWEFTLNELVENHLHNFPQSFLVLDCENKKMSKEKFVNSLEDFCKYKFKEQKVCLINSIDKANIYLQNSILKNLEEAKDINYLLTASNIVQIMPTVLSRVILVGQPTPESFEDDIISVASNYNVDITRQEVISLKEKVKKEDASFVVPKLKDEEIIKYIIVWQQLKIISLKRGEEKLTEEVGSQLFITNEFLNLCATKMYSKTIAIANLVSNF